MEAANAFALGRADAVQEAMLIVRNRDLQRLMIHNEIRDIVFQRCQAFYVDEVTKIAVEEAAELRKAGKSISVVRQEANPGTFSGGTDLDLITRGKTTPEDITELQRRISERLDARTKAYLRENPDRRPADWFKANDIDLMADPRLTTAEDFRAISRQNNFAYKSSAAARFEEWKRLHPDDRPPLRVDEMAEYMDEMKSAAARREEEIQQLRRTIREFPGKFPEASVEGSRDWIRLRDLEADLHVVQAQKSKLIHRMHETTDMLMTEFPVGRKPVRGWGLSAKGKSRDLVKNPYSPRLAASLEKELVEDAFARHAEALAAVAKTHPELAEACAENLRRTAGHLSARKQVEVVESIRNLQGDEIAESVWNAFKDGGKLVSQLPPPKSLGAAARSAREAGEDIGRALRGQNYEEAVQQLRRLKRDMALAQEFGGVPGTATGADDLLRRVDDLYGQAENLSGARRSAFLSENLSTLFQDPGLRVSLDDYLKRTKVESALLEALTRESDSVRRGMLQGILSEGGAFRELRDGMTRLAGQVPVETILTGVFAALDVIRVEEAYRGGRMDEAMRAAFEGVVGITGGAAVGLVTAVGNMVIDAAKEGGYVLATGSQDLEDFLAGIVSVKGWEQAEGRASPSETMLESLARQHATSEGLEAVLDKLIREAAARSNDTLENRAGKISALKAKLWPQLHAAWLRLRMERVNRLVERFERFDRMMQDFELEGVCIPETPEILRRRDGGAPRAEADIRVGSVGDLGELNRALEGLQAGVRALGGAEQLMSLGAWQEITLRVKENGKVFQANHTNLERLLMEEVLTFEEPGEYTLEIESVFKLTPYNTNTEMSHETRFSWSLLAPLSGLDIDLDSHEVSLKWVPMFQYETITKNDRYRVIEFRREYRHKTELKLFVVDRGGDDRVIARVTAPRRELLVGESLLASVELDSRARLGDDIRLRWSGKVKPVEMNALFTAEKPGRFRIGAVVFRETADGTFKLADAEPFEVRVLAAEDLQFSLRVQGDSRAKTGEAFRLRSERRVRPASVQTALEGMWVEWSVDGELLGTGPHIILEPVEAGEYPIVARLLEESDTGPVERARAEWRVMVTGDSVAENVPKGSAPLAVIPDPGGSAGGGGPFSPLSPMEVQEPHEPGNVVQGEAPASAGESEGREVMVGESVNLDFSPPYQQRYPEVFSSKSQQQNTLEAAKAGDGGGVALSPGAVVMQGSGSWVEQEVWSRSMRNQEMNQPKRLGPFSAGPGKYRAELSYTPDIPVVYTSWNNNTGMTVTSGDGGRLARLRPGAGNKASGKAAKEFVVQEPGQLEVEFTAATSMGDAGAYMEHAQSYSGKIVYVGPLESESEEKDTDGEDSVSVKIEFTYRSDGPVAFQPDSSADGRTRVTFSEPGTVRVWADVRITENGKTRTEKSTVYVFNVLEGEPEITLAGLKPEVTFGQSSTVSAIVKGVPPNQPARVVWLASPTGNPWAQPFTEGTGNTNTLTFGRMGTVRVFADLQVKKDGSWVKVAGSEVREVEVVAPEFSLVYDPAKDARIGDTLRVKVETRPKVPEDLMDIRWTRPAKRQTLAPDASEISLVIGEGGDNAGAPVSLSALVVAKGSGDRIGELNGTYTPGTYELEVGEPRTRGITPQVWDPEKGGLVNVPQGTMVTHQEVDIQASLKPAPKTEVRYEWSVSPAGARTHGSTGANQTFSAHKAGSYVISVVARTPGGLELARGQRSVSVVEQNLENEKKFQAQKLIQEGQALEKQNEWKAALRKYQAAQGLVANKEVAELIESVRKRIAGSERAQALVREGYQLEKEDKLREALAKYEAAQALVPNDGVAQRMEMLRKRIADLERAQALVREGYQLEKEDKLREALAKYESAQALVPNEGVAQRMEMLRKRIADLERAQALVREGYQLEKEDKLEAALAKYEQAQALATNEGVAQRMEMLRKRIADRARAQALVREGYQLEKEDKLREALAKYEQAQALAPNEGVAQRMEMLRKRIADRERAQALVREGYQLEKEDKLEAALAKYEAAQALVPNEGVAGRMEMLRKRIANRERAQALVKEGYGLEKREDWAGAINRYEAAQKLAPDEGVAQRIQMLRRRISDGDRAQEQLAERQRQAEQQRLAELQRRNEEERRRQEALARKQQEEQRRQQEQARRRAEQERMERERATPWTGTFHADIAEDGTRSSFTFVLVQNGSRLTGEFIVKANWSGGSFSESYPAKGSCNGNRATITNPEGDGMTLTLSNDGRTITQVFEGQRVTYHRIK